MEIYHDEYGYISPIFYEGLNILNVDNIPYINYEHGEYLYVKDRVLTVGKQKDIENKIKIHEALKYLADTDYYYLRFLETGEPVPEDVVLKRKEARDFLRANPVVV